jgi:HAE1 family hydrophobic/amphiphilic exporter-1
MMSNRVREELRGIAIADISIKQPVLITMLVLLAIVIGIFSYTRLPVNAFPDISLGVVSVVIRYPGAGPESVARQITEPVEAALNTLGGVRSITSSSDEALSSIVIQFNDAVNRDQALSDVREAVNRIRPELPTSVRDPVVQAFSFSELPILQLAVSSNGSRSALEIRQLVEREFVPAIRRVTGVGSVNLSGGQQRQINVNLQLERMQATGVVPAQVSAAIGAANTSAGLGSITNEAQRFNLRSPSLFDSASQIATLPIAGTRYLVGDVATIEDGVADQASYARLNSQDAVTIGIVKKTGANTVAVSQGVQAELNRLFAAYPDLTRVITVDDAADVQSQVNSSLEEIVLAVLAALLVVLFFFRDVPNTLVTMAGLPVILIATFAALWLFGLSINIISLLALALSVGLVIDDAIVVRENIFRYMERGFSPIQAASRATAEVATSVLAMTLTIIAVFLPVAFTSGTVGVIFRTFGIAVAAAMAISLIEAFTFAPMLSAHLFKGKKAGPARDEHATLPENLAPHEEHEAPTALGRWYGRVLAWSLRRRWVPALVAVGFLGLSVVAVTGIKTEFLPAGSSTTLLLNFATPAGTTLNTTDELARRAEAIIQSDPGVTAVQAEVTNTSANLAIRLKSSKLSDEVRDRLRPQLSFLPKLAFSRIQADGSGGAGVTDRTLQIQVRSTRPLAELAPLANQVEQVLTQTPGVVDIGSTYNAGQPEIRVTFDPLKLRDLGVGSDSLQSAIGTLLNGDTVATLRQNGVDTNIVLRLDPQQRANPATLANLSLPTSNGAVLLGSVAQIEQGNGAITVNRRNLQNEIVIGANIADGSDTAFIQQQINAALAQIARPSDVTIVYGGAASDQNEGFGSLYIAMGLSVLFVYMVLASQFGSFLQPIVIMLAMPFSFLGAFLALRLVGLALDITAIIGLILLLGLVVKNSILLVDRTNQLREAGLETHAALVQAGIARLRPILMTSSAIVAGAIPSALGIHILSESGGFDIRRGIAVVLIGGMLTSTVLTLLIVPTAYSVLDSLTTRARRIFQRAPQPEQLTIGAAVSDAPPSS